MVVVVAGRLVRVLVQVNLVPALLRAAAAVVVVVVIVVVVKVVELLVMLQAVAVIAVVPGADQCDTGATVHHGSRP